MPHTAQQYIDSFRRGESFHRPGVGLVNAGQPDAAALSLLGRELAVADAAARENIVALLVDLGLRTDALTPKGAEVLRHAGILALLAGPGLAQVDAGREAALEALRRYARASDLAPFGAALLAELRDAPGEELLLLVAKAKPVGGRAVVDALAASARWQASLSARIARAALGATEVEDEFVAAADTATDGRALASALARLSVVGTPHSLRVIASHLRTPLTIVIPGAMEKSARLEVLDALRYNFPDQPQLYPNNISRASGYGEAERFCTETLGVRFDRPAPPFMTYGAVPIPAR